MNKFEKNVLLIKYGEIALRKSNRFLFENKIIETIRRNLKGLGDYYVFREQGRFILERLDSDMDFDIVIPKVKTVLGINQLCPCIKTNTKSIGEISEIALRELMDDDKETKTFKVDTRRSDKSYYLDSFGVSSSVGEYILDNSDKYSVNVKSPDVVIRVEIRNDVYIYLSSKAVSAYGGLPEGTSGTGHLLLSGGIDSPVAYFLMAKRGVKLTCVYFHSAPYTSERVKEKVKDLVRILGNFTGGATLLIVPFTKVQLFLVENVAEEKLTIFLKRAMLTITDKIAANDKSLCIVTGDSIGQVASQTMHALRASQSATVLPIIRPLAAMDKQQIIDIAHEIGTFETSILPYDDCCTTFVAKHPDLKPKASVIDGMAQRMEERISPLYDEAIEGIEIFKS